jgi:RNA polymerase sigma-70 factor (ECF subfamily)
MLVGALGGSVGNPRESAAGRFSLPAKRLGESCVGIRRNAGAAPAEMADREVDQLWLRGDERALPEVHRRYRHRLEAVAYRIVGNRADAEDVVQRVFLALPGASYGGRASLWTYLYRAAANGAVNVLRSRRRIAALEEANLGRLLDGERLEPDAGPESRVFEGEVMASVARALLQVKPRHRRALVLRIVWGLTNSEIAERENVPLATVGTWLRRGREELRRAMGPTACELASREEDQ